MFGAPAAAPQPLHPQLGYSTDGSGSRVVPFAPTVQEPIGGAAGSKQLFKSVCSMPQYAGKSQEELRLEDYVANVRGQVGAQPHGAHRLSPHLLHASQRP